MAIRSTVTRATTFSAFGALLVLSACAPKVTRDDFNNEVAKLREEMQTGDQRLASRIDSNDARFDQLQKDLQSFRQEYDVSMERLKGQLRFNVPVHFAFNSSDIREADQPLLERFASVVKDVYPGALITVEGFTDPAGSTRYNQRLGLQRAESVKSYLVQNGLTDQQLRTVSYGETRPRQVEPGARGPGETGLSNRRVAFVIEQAPENTAAPADSSRGVAVTY